MEAIKQILQSFGYDTPADLPTNEYIEIQVSGFDDLTIERIAEDRISVSHTYTKRMDVMRDPEIVFDFSGSQWNAVMFQNDSTGQYKEDKDNLRAKTKFAKETWSDNLINQGFVEAARNQDTLRPQD